MFRAQMPFVNLPLGLFILIANIIIDNRSVAKPALLSNSAPPEVSRQAKHLLVLAFKPFVSCYVPMEENFLASTVGIDTGELKVGDYAHQDWVGRFVRRSLLAAAGTLAPLFFPLGDTLGAEQLVLTLVALQRRPILSDDHVANGTGD